MSYWFLLEDILVSKEKMEWIGESYVNLNEAAKDVGCSAHMGNRLINQWL
jgi:hypothetical protein